MTTCPSQYRTDVDQVLHACIRPQGHPGIHYTHEPMVVGAVQWHDQHAVQVREQPRTWDAVTGAAERRHVLLTRERDAARTAEREACAQRVFAWAASLSSEHDRLVAAKAAEVVLDPTR